MKKPFELCINAEYVKNSDVNEYNTLWEKYIARIAQDEGIAPFTDDYRQIRKERKKMIANLPPEKIDEFLAAGWFVKVENKNTALESILNPLFMKVFIGISVFMLGLMFFGLWYEYESTKTLSFFIAWALAYFMLSGIAAHILRDKGFIVLEPNQK